MTMEAHLGLILHYLPHLTVDDAVHYLLTVYLYIVMVLRVNSLATESSVLDPFDVLRTKCCSV